MLRRHLRWAMLLLPLPLLSFGMVRAADRIGTASGAELARIMSKLSPHETPREPEFVSDSLPVPESETIQVSDAPKPSARKSKSKRQAKKAQTQQAAARGVRVSAQTVLRLAARGSVPRGVPVSAQGVRPAGLRLVNVSALGIGIRDGDVLTDAAGRRVRSASDVISVVIAARARMAPQISGHFWRGAQRFTIVVEQPYLKDPPATAQREGLDEARGI